MEEVNRAVDRVHVNQVPDTILPPTTVPNQEAVVPKRDSRRTPQQRMLATAVQTRSLAEIITGSDTTYTPTTIADQGHLTFNATVTNRQNQQVLAIPDTSLYIGITDRSGISDSTQWPNSSVNAANFAVYVNPSDWGLSDGTDQVCRVSCFNNTGSTQSILLVVHWRVIAQPQILGSSR